MLTAVIAIAGLLTTLLAALLGPIVGARAQAAQQRQQHLVEQRLTAYTDFAAHVETIQYTLDTAAVRGIPVDSDMLAARLHDLGVIRVRLDLLAPEAVRRWAYRCRLAIEATARELRGSRPNISRVVSPRAKLHMARARFVNSAQIDLREEPDRLAPTWTEDLPFDDTHKGHIDWLQSGVPGDAIQAVNLALKTVPFRAGPGSN